MRKDVKLVFDRAVENKYYTYYFTYAQDSKRSNEYMRDYLEDVEILELLEPKVDWVVKVCRKAWKQYRTDYLDYLGEDE